VTAPEKTVLERAEEALDNAIDESDGGKYLDPSCNDLIPICRDLLAEARRLEAEVIKQSIIAGKLGYEAAKWRKIAIEERAKVLKLLEAERRGGANLLIQKIAVTVEGDLFRERAARELETESGEHFSGSTKMIELTPERRAALEALSSMQTEITCPECGAWMGFDDIKPHMAALRAMLAEGCIKICECGMNLEYQALAELEHVLSEFRKARP